MQNRFSRILLYTVVWAISLAGCGEVPSVAPTARISDKFAFSQTCPMPCWAGIRVGVTTFDETESILRHHYQPQYLRVQGKSISWADEDAQFSGVKEGNISFADSTVSEILLALDEQKGRLMVQDLLAIHGDPTWVAVSWGGPVRRDTPCLGVSLHYPRKGVIATLDTRNTFKGVAASQLVAVLGLMPIATDNPWQVSDAKLLKWEGYQDYCRIALDQLKQP